MAYNTNTTVALGALTAGKVTAAMVTPLATGTAQLMGYAPGSPGANSWNSVQTHSDLNIGGQSLKEFMYAVQDRLAIMRPNPELEKSFEELEACGRHYRELEAKFLEQQKAWDVLKATDR